MTASELIHDLHELIQEYGDLEVVDDQDNSIMIKFSQGDAEEGTEDCFVAE